MNSMGRKGSVLLVSMIMLGVISIAFYFFSVYVVDQKKQVTKNTQILQKRLALHGALDYVLFGIKQKYCFTSLLLNDTQSNCNLTHNASVERLIMSADQESALRSLIASGVNMGPHNINNLHIDSFSATVAMSAITTVHPLYTIMEAAKDPQTIQGLRVLVERDNSRHLPRNGREGYLRVTVQFTDAQGNGPVMIGTNALSLTSFISIHPREVGSFALLIPGSLYLDRAYNAVVPAGSSSIHNFPGNGNLGNSTGLVFDSPIFVNYDIHMPHVSQQSGGHQGSSQSFTPVTFADKVYLGNGYIYENGVSYGPSSSGGDNDRLWSQNKLIGGMLRGIDIDGGLDKGLSVFGGVVNGGNLNTSLMNQCILYYNNLSSSTYLLQNSDLRSYFMYSQNNGSKQKFRITVDRHDQFSPQSNSFIAVNTSQWGTGTAQRNVPNNRNSGAIINVVIAVGNHRVEAQLPSGGDLEVRPQVGSATALAALQNTLATKNSALTSAQGVLQGYQTSLTTEQNNKATALTDLGNYQATKLTLQGQIATLQAALQNQTGAQAAATQAQINILLVQLTTVNIDIATTQNLITQLNATISNLQTQITQQQPVIAGLQVQVNTAQNNLNDYNYKVQHPPKIKVSIDDYYQWGRNQRYKKELEIKVNDPENMLDENGNLTAPIVGITAYNPSFARSVPLGIANANLIGYYNFQLNGNNNGYNNIYGVSRTANSAAANMGTEQVVDIEQLIQDCRNQANTMPSQAFGGADWSVDFSAKTRHSWNFARGSAATGYTDPALASYIFDNTNSSAQSQNVLFQVRSIVGICTVRSTATFVTGFFACDRMIIEPRTTPLRIIGSFIVKDLEIHPTALTAGIRWSTIYHPQAVHELRAAGVLKTESGQACGLQTSPIWHPIPSIQETADRISCSVSSLRAMANPFQWTSVDPDCGLVPGNSNNSCKSRMVRFYLVEHSREGGI